MTVGGDGGFDYIVADSAGPPPLHRAQRQDQSAAPGLDLDSLKQVGELDGISAHGAVVDASNHHGFASSKPLTMFDSTNTATLKSITVDGNPDGLTLDAPAHRVYVLSHSAPNITAINTADGSILGTVNLDAAVEETQSDGKGHLYVALEDKDAVGVVDTNAMTVDGALSPGAARAAPRRAWRWIPRPACCSWPAAIPAVMVMMNADTGAILTTLPIGAQNDGVLFNPATNEALAATGDGHLTVIKENGPAIFRSSRHSPPCPARAPSRWTGRPTTSS